MARRKGGAHGGHGWFVTFADLMALLMSFFVMVAAYSSANKEKMQQVAGSMREAFGNQRERRHDGVVEKEGIPTKPHLKNVRQAPPEQGSDFTEPNSLPRKIDGGLETAKYDRAFGLAAASLRQAIGEMPDYAEASKNVIIEQTREGLNVSLVDQDGRAMFADGSTQPYERTRRLVEKIAPILRRMPNRVTISGHTAAARPGTRGTPWSVWDLSVGRASAIREILAVNGLPEDRFAAIVGRGDTEPMFPDNPWLAVNRRVTITLMSEVPPVPFGIRP